MTGPTNRREFLRHTAAFGAGVAAIGSGVAAGADDAPEAKAVPAGEKIVIGVMGMGRGTDVAMGFASLPGAVVKYVCDVDADRAAAAAASVGAKQGHKPEAVKDFRRILDDGEVDALAIAAPDHWHAPAAILAIAAGKHVYVEKPCCHNPREGELLVEAARKHNRVVQHGTQRRSWSRVREAIEKVHKGEIGRVLFSRGWYTNERGPMGTGKVVSPPAKLDYELWQGPAPERPYKDNVVHYNWHWLWHWGTSELGNNGVHSLDLCRWGLQADCPVRVTAGGGRYYHKDDQETPDTMNVTFDYGDKAIVWEGRSCLRRGMEGSQFGVAFYGDAATIVIDANDYKVYDKEGKQAGGASDLAGDAGHLQNFLDCVKSGGRPNADIEEGYKGTLMCLLGNIAWRTGHALNVDPKTGRVVGDPEAEKLWSREYRPGWEPKV